MRKENPKKLWHPRLIIIADGVSLSLKYDYGCIAVVDLTGGIV